MPSLGWCDLRVVPERCPVVWGSHGCYREAGHTLPHVCGTLEDPCSYTYAEPSETGETLEGDVVMLYDNGDRAVVSYPISEANYLI